MVGIILGDVSNDSNGLTPSLVSLLPPSLAQPARNDEQ